MRVFVTGGTGFIGHYVVKALLEKGHEVVVATRHPNKVPTLRANPNVSFVGHAHERYACNGGSP